MLIYQISYIRKVEIYYLRGLTQATATTIN